MGQETSPAYHDWRTRCEERGGAGWHSHAAVSSSLCAKHADGRVGGGMMSLLLTTWHRKLMFTQLDSTHTHTQLEMPSTSFIRWSPEPGL